MLPLPTVDDPWTRGGVVRATILVLAALAFATAVAALLEGGLGVADASPVYLLAVVLVAGVYGMWPAVATSGLSFLAYDFLFTSPRLTFTVADPAEWLSLLLFLFVAVVIGRLTALLRERVEMADRRARESVSLVSISRAIAAATSFEEAAAEVAERLCEDAEMAMVSIALGDEGDEEMVAAAGEPLAGEAGTPWTLMRSETDDSSDWLRIVAADRTLVPIDGGAGPEAYLVPIEADRVRLGSIRATRPADAPRPGRGARRILSLAADQLGFALRRDELRAELTTAEVARQSDALRAAILDSVSHDLRTPIATIRALAGGIVDPALKPGRDELRAAAAAIDAEAQRLADLVRNLLDMGRIQAGAIHPDVEPYELDELVDTALRRLAPRFADRPLQIDIPDALPPVLVDAVLFDVAATNVLDNALTYALPPAPIRVSATVDAGGAVVVLCVDDGGPGVPADTLPHLFDRFYRVPADAEPARHGLGMGLAIASGFLDAMGGTIAADRSDLGGLRIRIGLPVAPPGGDDRGLR